MDEMGRHHPSSGEMPAADCLAEELEEEGLSLAECEHMVATVKGIALSAPDWFPNGVVRDRHCQCVFIHHCRRFGGQAFKVLSALDDGHSQFIFQTLDGRGQSGLGHVTGLCRSSKVPFLG
jgi:hypothetical protein